jgi:rod shape-determining protein MreB
MSMLKELFLNALYVRITADRIDLKNVISGASTTLVPQTPFSHPRALLGNFTVAEALLKKGFKEVVGKSWFALAPQMLVHPMEMIEGGLTQIEERALTELALGAGARSVVIWTGNVLSDQEVLDKLGQK